MAGQAFVGDLLLLFKRTIAFALPAHRSPLTARRL
jgi:hypothetical protein